MLMSLPRMSCAAKRICIADDDGVHFRALEVTSEPPPAATVAMTPQIALKSILKPARIVYCPVEKGAKSERTMPFRDYTVAHAQLVVQCLVLERT
jgi:hypothetical protein